MVPKQDKATKTGITEIRLWKALRAKLWKEGSHSEERMLLCHTKTKWRGCALAAAVKRRAGKCASRWWLRAWSKWSLRDLGQHDAQTLDQQLSYRGCCARDTHPNEHTPAVTQLATLLTECFFLSVPGYCLKTCNKQFGQRPNQEARKMQATMISQYECHRTDKVSADYIGRFSMSLP